VKALRFRSLILEQHGYRVISASDAEEALSHFRSNNVDLVITDHLIGRATGTRVALEMKRQRPDVPILVLTGMTEVSEADEQSDAYMSKTEGPQALLLQVEQLLKSKEEQSAQMRSLQWEDRDDVPVNNGPTLRKLLAAIVENSQDAIISKTLFGTITTWNRSAERIYGYKAEEVIGRPISLLLPPDRPNEVNEILARLRKGEHIDHFETRRVTKDGRILDVSLSISPIRDDSGKVIGASTIARDITQMKAAEQALRSAEKLAVAGRMAATVAHEINNPLEALANILFLLDQNASLNEEGRSFVHAGQEELRRVMQITRLTLGFHRERTGTTSVKVTDLLDNVLTLYARKISSLGLKVERRYQTDASIEAFSGELRQVFSNLIVNAVDALSESGDTLAIHVQEGVDWRDLSTPGVRISISDNGPGIPAKVRNQLFHAFFTTKGEKGTGIGLWVSREIVRRHGGEIRLHSSNSGVRQGSTFSIFLPLHFPAETRAA
jgi:two-component system CheB/CheR fusion protein